MVTLWFNHSHHLFLALLHFPSPNLHIHTKTPSSFLSLATPNLLSVSGFYCKAVQPMALSVPLETLKAGLNERVMAFVHISCCGLFSPLLHICHEVHELFPSFVAKTHITHLPQVQQQWCQQIMDWNCQTVSWNKPFLLIRWLSWVYVAVTKSWLVHLGVFYK